MELCLWISEMKSQGIVVQIESCYFGVADSEAGHRGRCLGNDEIFHHFDQ